MVPFTSMRPLKYAASEEWVYELSWLFACCGSHTINVWSDGFSAMYLWLWNPRSPLQLYLFFVLIFFFLFLFIYFFNFIFFFVFFFSFFFCFFCFLGEGGLMSNSIIFFLQPDSGITMKNKAICLFCVILNT